MAEPTAEGARAICNYEGTSYRADFWDGHGREYEDLAERIAMQRLLPPRGRRLVEVGAGFGRLADLYAGYDQVVLLDYARSGLLEARARLGDARFVYVAADLYRLPLAPATCDTAVTVRVLHHVTDVPAALQGLATVLRPGGTYVLEYANKRHLKAVARFILRRQNWSPFDAEPYEFTRLNYDFHPRWMAGRLTQAGFTVEDTLAVSHFRHRLIKRLVPAQALARLDGRLQRVGAVWKLTPSVFARARKPGEGTVQRAPLFRCPVCGGSDLQPVEEGLHCMNCRSLWARQDGIYDFRSPAGGNK